MRHRISASMSLLGAITLLGSNLAPTFAQAPKTGGDDQPVTLRLATFDSEQAPSHPIMEDFIKQVGLASGGTITIEPTYGAAPESGEQIEQVVAQRIVDGDFDLGMVAGRAWNPVGVTSLQALQAPFLITDDNLATAVADSDIATRALDGMAPAGVVGLALWPEDLRHPFSWVEPILTPADLVGKVTRAMNSQITYEMLTALGATPVRQFNDQTVVAESGLRQGFSLDGHPTATGNVTFFPKYDVLVANADAWASLSDAQQTAIRDAAAITRTDAIEAHQTDVEAGAAWCADGGHIVLASDEQVAAFEAATASIYEHLEQDPLTKQLISDIRALKAKTEPAPSAAACAPAAVQSPGPSGSPVAVELPPDGVYRAAITVADMLAAGSNADDAGSLQGVSTWTFDHGAMSIVTDTGVVTADNCHGTYAIVGAAVRFTWAEESFCWGWDDLRLTSTNDGLDVTFVQCGHPNPGQCNTAGDRAWFQRTWAKIQ